MVDLETGLCVTSYFRPSPPSLRIGVEIGRGFFAVVHEGELDGRPVAVKKLLRREEDKRWRCDIIEEECRLLERLRHPNIVGFSGAFYDIKSEEPMIVMEILKEKLKDFVNREGKLSLLRQLKLCLGLASGLEYIHSRSPPVVHGDLTDENVMLSEEGDVKIADFGMARSIRNARENSMFDEIYINYDYNYYIAPELYDVAPYSPVTLKVDMFSLGVWMLRISKGYCPPGVTMRSAEDMSSLHDGHLLKPFILKCMKEDYKERPSAAAVHSFIESQVVSCM